MNFRLFGALCAFFAFTSLFAAEVTRSIELSADQTSAVFAVPNGFSFTRAYASDAKGNAVDVSVGEPTVMNHVTLIPLAVDLSASSSTSTSSLNLTVVFEDNGPLFTGRPAKVMRQAIKEKVANPEDVPTTQYVAPTRSRLKLAVSPLSEGGQSPAGADVLILSPHDNVELWQQYATFRKSTAAGTNLEFLVKDLNEVYRDYPFNVSNTDGTPRNAAESIHKYLRDNRDNLGLSYVILGGSWIDAQFINANGDWERNGNVVKTLDGNNMSLTNAVPGIIAHPRRETEEIPSDMFYACLDLKDGQTYPWTKGDATHYYESFNNESDRAEYDSGVDVVVSRIAFKPLEFTIPEGAQILAKYESTMRVGESHLFTPAELMDYWCEKIRRAEAEDYAGMGRMGFSWGDFNYMKRPSDGSLPEEYEFYDDIPNLFATDRQTDRYGNLEIRERQRIKTLVAPNYPIRAVDARCDHGTTWTKGLESVAAAQEQFLATDHDFNVVAMHGWAGGSAWYHVEDTYKQTGLILFNDMSLPCETGWPDFVNGTTYISQPCCGEATVAVPFGGSIASVNNTRSGFEGGAQSLSDRHNFNSHKGFLQEGLNAGKTWLKAHLDFAGISAETAQDGFAPSNNGGTGAWVLSEHILYGDPLVRSQAFKVYDSPLSTFPQVAKSAVLASEVTVSQEGAVVTATTASDITITGSGTGRMKITKVLKVGGTSVTINGDLEGGIALIKFMGEPGMVTINSTGRFYLGGVENCASIVVNGNGAIIDCDHISGVTAINFTVDDSASNILRGKTVGALAGVAINSIGGSLVFESHDLLGNTTVQLEGTTVKLGSDPTVGSLVASGEPLRATFTGSGIIEYQHGTELLRDWTIAGQIMLKEIGELAIGFDYTGALGSNPTGWFSSWGGENFDDTEAYLAPRGFVHVVKDGKHPHASLPAKTGFTMALYANLVKVANSNAVLLSYGTVNSSDSQILLVKNGEKIQLVVTRSYGGTALASVEADYPGAGYHLYIIERKGNELSLKIDGGEKKTINCAFTLSSGLQIGSQFGGLNGRNKAIGMAVAGLRGYDALLNADEMSALIAEFPAMSPPITVDADIELNVEGVEARLINATITNGHYLGGSNGDLYVPDTVTVNVQGMKLNNTSRSADAVTNDVYGVLNVTGTTTRGPYEDLQNPSTMAGIMLGHWAGTSTLNIHTGGLVNAPNGELLMGYTANGNLNINGGKLVVRSITNYSRIRGVRKDGCPITITNGGTLEIADWPCQNQTAPGTMPITIDNGTIKATADWTCPWPLTVSGPLTIDANGYKLVFLGAHTGSGKITVVDSSEAKTGSVLFSGDLTNYANTIRVSSEVTAIGVRAGQEAKLDFAGAPAKLMVALSSSQLNADYDATAFASRVAAGATVEFTDYSGYDYQSIPGTTRYTQWSPMDYVYDGITWGNVYLPYERGIWEPLINWREFKSQTVNGETYTKAIQKYVSGAAPQATSNCGRWDPIILNGDEFEGEKGEDGFYDVHVDYLEGWLIRLGLYNGVHLYVENLNKVQRGGASNPTPYIRVGANSRLTIAKCGTGNTDVTIPLYVASSDGIVFKTNVFDKNFEYYLTEGGSVKFESGVSAGTHKVKEVHATAGDATGAYYNLKGVKVADFNNKGSTARFTSEDGALKLAGYDGTTRYLANSLAILSDAKSSGLGGFTLMQGDVGVYAMYAEKSVTPPTEITINGNQTDLNLVNLPYDTITKIKIAGAWGYFKGEDHTISTQVEFNDTAAGLPAFRWENGYGSKYVAFENATGHGTIFINGGTRTSQAMFFKGGDFDGSIILTNGNNRVFFGPESSVQQAWASRIEVKSGATANLKDGGIWAASELAIDGTLVCKGRADVICFGGITGVDHIEIPDGYAKSVMKIGGNVARVWVLPQGEVPQAEGQLNFQFGAVTIPSFDMGAHLLEVTSGTVTLAEDAVVIAPRLEVAGGASFVAAAKVGDAYYGSFANAVAAANNGVQTITLLSDISDFNLAVGNRLSINKNGHEITFANGLVVEETIDGDTTRYQSTSTRYDLAYHVKDVDNGDWDVSDLTPKYFTIEHFPVMLPKPTAGDKVFHGWYRETDYSDTAIDRINDDMLPRMEFALYGYWLPAVATVNGVAYDNWEDAIAAHEDTGYSIRVLAPGNEPIGYFTNEDGYLVQLQATVQVGETTTRFSSFAAARTFAKGKDGAEITLITNSPSDLVLDDGETVLVNLNGYSLEVEAAHPENYVVRSAYDEATGVTTYSALTPVARVDSMRYGTLADAVANLGDATTIDIIGNIDAATIELTKNTTLNVLNDCTFSAVLSGSYSLTKTGAGTLTINAAQTLTGDFIVAEGKVEASAAVRAKNADAYVEVRTGASLKFTTNVQEDCHYAFKLAGDGVEHEGALIFGAAQSWYSSQAQSITLAGDATITADWTGEGGTGLVGSGYAETAIELNGHILTKKGSRPLLLVHTTVSDSVGTGKIYVAEGVVELANGDHTTTINVPVEAAANAGLDVQAPIKVNVPANKTYTITAQRVNSGVTNRTATLADGATLIATTGLFATANVTSSVATAEVLSTTEGVTSGFTKFWAELPRMAYEVTDAQIAELGEFSQGSIGEIAVPAPTMTADCTLTAPTGYYAWRKDASTVYVAKKTNSISVKLGARTQKDSAGAVWVTSIQETDTSVGGFPIAGKFWNNSKISNGNNAEVKDIMSLKDGNGDSTQVTLAYRAPNTYYQKGDTSLDNGNERLTGSYFDDGGDSATTTYTIGEGKSALTLPEAPCTRGWQMKIQNIPYQIYDVYIYFASDQPADGLKATAMALSVDGGTNWKWYAGDPVNNATIAAAQSNTWKANPYSDGTLTEGTNYIRIRVSAAAFGSSNLSMLDLTHAPRNTGSKIRSGLAGIQIVEVDDDGVYTRVADSEGKGDSWTAAKSWKNSKGEYVDWPTFGYRQARINADEVSSIRLTSAVEANMVIVANNASDYTADQHSFKFLTDEDLNEVANEVENPTCILKAPVDTTNFCGDLYLQSRIAGKVTLGDNAYITFVALEAGKETTAYPYTFEGSNNAIRKIGPGTFRVPLSMAMRDFNITEGFISYDYNGTSTVQLGKVTGNGTAILKSSNLQLVADNTAALDLQADYLKVTGNLFASGSTKKLEIPEGKTVDVIDNSNQTNARDGVYTGTGTLKFSGTAYHVLNSSSLPAKTLKVEIEIANGLIFPNEERVFELGTICGNKGFRSDYNGNNGETKRNLRVTQSANTTWSGNFMQSTDKDRFGTFYVAGAEGAAEKTLTIAGDCSGADNNLVVDASGSVKLTGTWKGNVTVNGEFGGTGTIQNSTVTFAAGSTLNAAWGPMALGAEASFAAGSTTIVGAAVGATIFTLGEGVEVSTLPTLTNTGYVLKQDDQAIKFVIAEGYAPVYAADRTTIESVRGVGKIYVSSDALSQAWGNEVTFETAEGKRTTFIKGNTPETTDTVVVLKTTQFWVKNDKAGTTLEIGDLDHQVIVAFAQSGDGDASYTVNGLHLKIAAGSRVDIDNQSRASDSTWKKDAAPFVHDTTIEGEGEVFIPLSMSATFSGTTTVSTAIKLEGSLIVNNTASIDESKLYTSEGARKYIKKTVNVDSVSYTIATVPEATKSLNLDGGYSTASSMIGGGVLSRTGDTFGSYVAVRQSTTNKGAVPSTSAGKNGIYCNDALFSNANTWSVLTVAKLDDTNNGVLWSCGRYNNEGNGLALIESSGNTVKLVKWTRDATPKHTEILSYTVEDSSLKCQLHSYIVTYQSTADGASAHKFTLYVDGVQATTSDATVTFSATGYQLCSVHGSVTGAGCAIGTGIILDEFGLWDGTALSAQEAAAVAAYYPVSDEIIENDSGAPFGTKVINLKATDSCSWTSSADGQTITSHVGEKYDQVVVTVMVNLPETTSDMRILAIGEGETGGTNQVTADLWWNGSKLFLGWDGGNKKNGVNDSTYATTAGLHIISYKLVWRDSTSTPVGVELFVDGSTTANAANNGIKWSGKKPTGTFTYQGDIKSITLDFSSANVTSGFATLPSITENGRVIDKTVDNLEKIDEILTMTDKRIDEGDIALDVSLGSFVETGAADTIGITVGTSLDLPNGEVTILVEDPNEKGKFVDLSSIDPLVAPKANPELHDARNKLVVPISSLLSNGAKSRLFKIQAKPKKR